MDCARVLVKPVTPPPLPRRPEIRSPVVSGTVNWKPINKTAALVVSKAPWWAQPPSPKPKLITKEKKQNTMTITPTNNPMLDGVYGEKSDTEFNMDMARQMGKHGIKDVAAAESLVDRAKEATAALDYLANHYQKSWIDISDLLASAVGEIRGKRFAVESETKQMLSALADVRKFFLDDRHETEVKLLGEFVDLCERLKVLKDSGFLDAVADTMLNLSLGRKGGTV
jgi:hypothetical protein